MASGARTPKSRSRSTRTQSSIRPLYETFEPKSEMKENENAYLLLIYLPGFVKEKIKINFLKSSRLVRVTGERPLAGNRISNFEQTYSVPEDCEVEKLHGKYELGTLTVTMPKKSINASQVSPKSQEETAQKTPPTPLLSSSEKPVLDQPKPKEVAMPPKSPTPRMEPGEKSIRDRSPRPKTVQEETMLKSSPLFASTPVKETGKSQKGQEEIEPKLTSVGDDRKIEQEKQEENKQNDIATYIEKVKKRIHEKEDKVDWSSLEERMKSGQRYINHDEVWKGAEIMKTRAKEGGEKGKENSESNTEKRKREEDDEMYRIGKGIKEVVASAKEIVTKIGEGKLNEEEKPLVANMGAAILVIMALGAYVTYKFTSSSKA
ncbi:inactive protein RESTRICTED TEV MOVEMENT 2-like [Vigna umbellata]|uniref:inactive protein RESTRICTED TEV MOVEMENT 2-like n=1 Tax=Vigna umbellata TaxID=87088 RepID=UPI001F5F517E|nr:inactive protein RESTRICTED TEV MOVEMENT 2-like [Vigna umbellata]